MLIVITSDTGRQTPAGSSVVNVNVTEPLAMSFALTVYVAVARLALLKPPSPLDVQCALEALPPKDPASCTVGEFEQITWSTPASTVGAGSTVMVAVLLLLIVVLHVQPVKVMLVIVRLDVGPFNAIVWKVPVLPAKCIVAVLPLLFGLVEL
jgi:hypothetical protein